MVIGFYPGGGGNRFYWWLKLQRTFELNRIYDSKTPHQIGANRYPGIVSGQVNTGIIFTHCLNYDLITETWPGHSEVYILDTDCAKSLRRQWKLFQSKISNNPHPVDGAFRAITWHNDYYNQYPFQIGNGIKVDCKSYPEFMDMINNELDSIDCPEFDFAQSMFDQFGSNASILELYNEHFK